MAYTLPTPADLRARYPAFAATAGEPATPVIPDATIQYWLDYVVGENVDQSWGDPAGARAQIAAAAHRMAVEGILPADVAAADLAGVSMFKSASFQVEFDSSFIEQQVAGGWGSTRYGQDYLELLRKFAAGPRVTAVGRVPFHHLCGYSGPLY